MENLEKEALSRSPLTFFLIKSLYWWTKTFCISLTSIAEKMGSGPNTGKNSGQKNKALNFSDPKGRDHTSFRHTPQKSGKYPILLVSILTQCQKRLANF